MGLRSEEREPREDARSRSVLRAEAAADSAADSADVVRATRRAFIGGAGAALSGPLAAVAIGTAGTVGAAGERARAAEDEHAIIELHHAYARCLNERAFEELLGLFTDEAAATLYERTYAGRARGIRSLYLDHFGARTTLEETPVHFRLIPDSPGRHVIVIAPDGRSAAVRFHVLAQAEAALPSGHPLIEMARLQGQGASRWWERGVLEDACERTAEGWKIARLQYRTLERVDHAV